MSDTLKFCIIFFQCTELRRVRKRNLQKSRCGWSPVNWTKHCGILLPTLGEIYYFNLLQDDNMWCVSNIHWIEVSTRYKINWNTWWWNQFLVKNNISLHLLSWDYYFSYNVTLKCCLHTKSYLYDKSRKMFLYIVNNTLIILHIQTRS